MALNPIACEHCRAKKCKCDRNLPHCSQCQALSLACRYTEGGKRGIPAAYINSLEDRLAETEAALFSALTIIRIRDSNDSGLDQLLVDVSGSPLRERSKIEKQDEWKRLPLRSGQQLHIWSEEKSRTDYHVQHLMRSPQNEHPQGTQSERFASNEAAEAIETCAEPSSIDNAATPHTLSNIRATTRFQDSVHWRNYF